MNGNYQVNKFHSQEKMKGYLLEAQAYRLAQSYAGGKNGRSAGELLYSWTTRKMNQIQKSALKLGQVRFSIPYPRYR